MPALETDSERLRTVLVNLLTNARQAVGAPRERRQAPSGSAQRAPSCSPPRALADHRVADLDPRPRHRHRAEDLPRVFDPYFTTRRAGTGLGLPIAKNIIDGLGGTITVASTPGAGHEHPHRARRRARSARLIA